MVDSRPPVLGYRVHPDQAGWSPPRVRLSRSECPERYRLGGMFNPTLAKWECMRPTSRAEWKEAIHWRSNPVPVLPARHPFVRPATTGPPPTCATDPGP